MQCREERAAGDCAEQTTPVDMNARRMCYHCA
jgi:hypothetical protein